MTSLSQSRSHPGITEPTGKNTVPMAEGIEMPNGKNSLQDARESRTDGMWRDPNLKGRQADKWGWKRHGA